MTRSRSRRPSVTQQQSNGRHLTPSQSAQPDTRTRLIRFRLNPRSSSDQQILAWLHEFAPYYRADAIRTALLTHILRRSVSSTTVTPPTPAPTPTTTPANGVLSIAAQKLEKLFSS